MSTSSIASAAPNAVLSDRVHQVRHKKTAQTRIIAPLQLDRWVSLETEHAVGLHNAWCDSLGVNNGFPPPGGFPLCNVQARAVILFTSSSTSVLTVRARVHDDENDIGMINISDKLDDTHPNLFSSLLPRLTLAKKSHNSPFRGVNWAFSEGSDSQHYSIRSVFSLAIGLLSPTEFPRGSL
jgi:hypothetical protein